MLFWRNSGTALTIHPDMGHCMHGKNGLCIKAGVQCYQDGLYVQKPNMPLSEFQRLARECKGKTFQFALGGRGDVDQHKNFKEIY